MTSFIKDVLILVKQSPGEYFYTLFKYSMPTLLVVWHQPIHLNFLIQSFHLEDLHFCVKVAYMTDKSITERLLRI